MNELEDAELVRACLDGDPEVYGVLVERYQKPLFNAAFGLVNDHEDAKDVAQSAFLKAFEKLRSYDPSYKFFSWLYRIAINESIDLVHRKSRLQGLEERASGLRGPEAAYASDEIGRHVHAALGNLRIEYRTVVVMRHFLGCSYVEIAEILQISEAKVKSRLFRAREQLRGVLEEWGVLA